MSPVGDPSHFLDPQLERKKQMLGLVRGRFARYGDRVCTILLQATLKTQGIQQLLERLGLPPVNDLDQAFDLVTRFLGEHGREIFLKRLTRSDPAPRASAPQTHRRNLTPKDPAFWIAPPDGSTPPHWFDAEGYYIGPERRNGKERRSGADRRAKIDCISKNKRFGGDRRRGDRRKLNRKRPGKVR